MSKILIFVVIISLSFVACSDRYGSNSSTKKSEQVKTINYENAQTCNEGIASLNSSTGEFQRIKNLIGREGAKSSTGQVIEKGFIEVEMIDEEGRYGKNAVVPLNEFIPTCGLYEFNKPYTPAVSINDIVLVKAENPNFWAVGYPNYVAGRVTKISGNTINYRMLVADEFNRKLYQSRAKRAGKDAESQSDVFEGEDWYLPTPTLAEKLKNLK